MTHQFQSNTTHEAVQLLAEHGFEAMAQAIQVLMNEAMRIGGRSIRFGVRSGVARR